MKMTPGAKALSCRVQSRILVTPKSRFRWQRRSGSLLEKLSGYLGVLRRGVNCNGPDLRSCTVIIHAGYMIEIKVLR